MVIFFKVNRNIKSMDRRQTVENRIKHTKQKKEEHNRAAGSDPLYATICPICDEGLDRTYPHDKELPKYIPFDLQDHLKNEHLKVHLASFLCQEVAYLRFWDNHHAWNSINQGK